MISTEGESRMPAGDLGISGKAVYTRVHCTTMYDYGLIRSITNKKDLNNPILCGMMTMDIDYKGNKTMTMIVL
jgi:hypothetical protein